ncbi:uncharacterized protein LOC126665061 isoform X3 [Mercurialis annua]|uniref:uncharacterized protein LOC126665061 isoform X3 n=1 Tax=Mercurialis annua TaxID=3986 RepID=UPI00215E7272|nr:uncharacterized protein LOC126665061 isoform X3 [Mercurialis annua]
MVLQHQQPQFNDQKRKQPLTPLITRFTVSFILVIFTHFSLSLIPRFFSTSLLLLQLTLSGFGGWCRRILGVNASAPAFVFFNLFFVWSVYFFVIRPVVPTHIDAVLNVEAIVLFIGICRMLSSDPGVVTHGNSHSDKVIEANSFDVEADNEDSLLLKRVRHCKSCNAYVKGFDHHCPAFGNCIGEKNHVLFMVLLLGFFSTETSYVIFSFQFVRTPEILAGNRFQIGLYENLVTSTMLFTLLQVIWQGMFMAWHIYCICFNIRTDEWINWKKYPEFQVNTQSQPGGRLSKMSFTNPYDKGILQNVKEFCAG